MAWQEGFPYARSIEHAKSAWAAHVDTWTELVAKGKKLERWRQWRRFHSEQPHYRMAWIVHEPFWQALRKTTANTMFAWWPELTREAALQGNTVALTHIPSYYTRAYFRHVQDASQSSHPRSVQWAIEHGILRDTFKHLNSWTLDSPLARSPWLNGYAGLDLTRRGSYEMAHWCLAALLPQRSVTFIRFKLSMLLGTACALPSTKDGVHGVCHGNGWNKWFGLRTNVLLIGIYWPPCMGFHFQQRTRAQRGPHRCCALVNMQRTKECSIEKHCRVCAAIALWSFSLR